MPRRLDLIVSGGTVVLPDGRRLEDIGVLGGRFVPLAPGDEAETKIDCTGLHVLPGVIDSQVHFRDPGLTHKETIETGSRAAVLGGVTTYFDEPNTDPTTTTAEALRAKIDSAQGRSWANFAFWVGASTDNIDELGDLERMEGTPGIGEVFMASSTGPLLVPDDASLTRVLKNGARRVAVHAEDEDRIVSRKCQLSDPPTAADHPRVRDVESSRLATERILRLSAETGRPVHVLHVSSEEELPLLQSGKKIGATCEVTPQHLSFTADDYAELGSRIQMNTPIRERRHRNALLSAVKDGLFDVFGSDHAPHTLEEKSRAYPTSPSGMPGVQTMLPVLLDLCHQGMFSLETVVRMSSLNPAKLFGVVSRGSIEQGAWADLAIVDLGSTWTVEDRAMASKCGWTPFHGRTLTGRVVHTVVNGRIAVRDGVLADGPGGHQATFDVNGLRR